MSFINVNRDLLRRVCAASAAVLIGLQFAGCRKSGGIFSSETSFDKGTTINGIDVSGMNAGEAKTALEEAASDYGLELVFKDSSMFIGSGDISYRLSGDIDLEAVAEIQDERVSGKEDPGSDTPEKAAARAALSDGDDLKLTVEGLFEYDEDALRQILSEADELDPSVMTKTRDAGIVYDEAAGEFVLEDAETGSWIDFEEAFEVVTSALDSMAAKVDFVALGMYEEPEFTSDSSEAEALLEEANSLITASARVLFGDDEEELIDAGVIKDWVTVEKDGDSYKAFIDREAAVKEIGKIAERHVPEYLRMDFETYYGGIRQYYIYNEGYTVDTDDLSAKILATIGAAGTAAEAEAAGEDQEDGELIKAGYVNEDGEPFQNFAGTYVEIDLDDQVLYLYKDGENILVSNIVSGCVYYTHMTPTGVYHVYSMETNVDLIGPGYKSHVSYWMPFNGSIGMHDATWRWYFGGSIYVYDGSHGCINLPLGNAEFIYKNIYIGYPVVVYGGITWVEGQTIEVIEEEEESDKKDEESETETETETEEPETETKAPETKAPETEEPETETRAPETKAPETEAPETEEPETETKAPETEAPETQEPETEPAETETETETAAG